MEIIYIECGNDLILLTGPSSVVNVSLEGEVATVHMVDVADFDLEGPAEIQAFLANLLAAGVKIYAQAETPIGKHVMVARLLTA